MLERPNLEKKLDSQTFQMFYYLKEELVTFCRQNGLKTTGSKQELTHRIAHYLETGEVLHPVSSVKKKPVVTEIKLNQPIEENFVCTEKHRAFYKEQIGPSFSFCVAFQKWLKSHAGKTYQDSIEAYYQIMEEKKKTPTQIDKQFEYNTYIRDFFKENHDKTLKQAILCWNYKKRNPGHHRYETKDLDVLEKSF